MMRRGKKEAFGRVGGWLTAIVWVASAMACGNVGPDDRSTEDRNRTGAREIPMDMAVTDAVNIQNGDATDWKFIEVSDPGTYTLEVWFDNPWQRASVNVHDPYGGRLTSASHASGEEQPEILTFTAEDAGPYFFQIHSEEGYTVYSVRAYTGPPRDANEQTPAQVVDPRPEFDRPI